MRVVGEVFSCLWSNAGWDNVEQGKLILSVSNVCQ